MQKKETAIEVKVGALVLFGIALLVAFVFVLGDFSLGSGFEFNVEFGNSGGLKPGADVAIAGINVGGVESLRFLNNEGKKKGATPVGVRVRIRVDKEYADAIRENSEFYITTRGVLGEPYIEIVTTDFGSAAVKENAVLVGIDPPRMDLIISKATDLLTVANDLLSNPEINTKDLIKNTSSLMKNLTEFIDSNRGNLDETVVNVKESTKEASILLAALNVAVGDGAPIKQTISDIRGAARSSRRIAGSVEKKIDPLMRDLGDTTKNAKALMETTDRLIVKNEKKISESLDNIHKSSKDLSEMASKTNKMVDDMAAGKGTVGALMTDEELYDDMKELMKVIKKRPWKIIWKE